MSSGGRREGAGRPKGSVNRATADVQARLAALDCDPFEGMALLSRPSMECRRCKGKKTILIHDEPMGCPVCNASGEELIPLEIRSSMFKELAQYVAPKRKAIEHSPGGDGAGFRIEIVRKGEGE